MKSFTQDSNYVYVNMEYSKLEPLGAFFLITFIGIMAIQVFCHNKRGSYTENVSSNVKVWKCMGGKLLYQFKRIDGRICNVSANLP